MADPKVHAAIKAAHAKAVASHKQTGQSLEQLGQLLAQLKAGAQPQQPVAPASPGMTNGGVSPMGGTAS